MPYEPTWKERLEDAKIYAGPAIAGLVVLATAAWLVWHEFRPREQTPKTAAASPTAERAGDEAKRRLSGEVDVLEKTYRRAVEAGEADAVLARMLDRAIARQRERLQLEPTDDAVETARLAQLEAQRAPVRKRLAVTQGDLLERDALAAPGTPESVAKLREALRLQREVNSAAGAAGAKNLPRETRLAQTIDQTEIGPTRAAVTTVLRLARAAHARGQTEAALKALTEARTMQADLSSRFPGRPDTHSALVEQIDAELDSLKSAGLAESSAAQERAADSAAKLGRGPEAAAAYLAAAAMQREINEKFRRSKFASAARSDQLEVKRQTSLSVPPLAEARVLDGTIATLLQHRQNSAAVDKISAALARVEKAAIENPRSTALDETLQNRLAYLRLRAAELDSLQEAVYSQLGPLPELKGVSMLKSEVSQDLYTRVMNGNPSRNPGRALPVDSVSWHEAQDFCRRLGWLLGGRVRLPTEAEFRAAHAGAAGRPAGPGTESWSADTSGGRSHEVGRSRRTPAGFCDLAGNLAEWLQTAVEGADNAPIAGGSFLDGAAVLQRLPVAVLDKRERARHVGFRVVVDLAPP